MSMDHIYMQTEPEPSYNVMTDGFLPPSIRVNGESLSIKSDFLPDLGLEKKQNFRFRAKIGEGAFAQVFKVEHIKTK